MTNKRFITAKEISEELEVSLATAYKIVREMNLELKDKGYLVFQGRVNRKYFEERAYYEPERSE